MCASHAPTLPRLLVLFFRLLSIEEVNTADKGESICNLLFDYDLFVATWRNVSNCRVASIEEIGELRSINLWQDLVEWVPESPAGRWLLLLWLLSVCRVSLFCVCVCVGGRGWHWAVGGLVKNIFRLGDERERKGGPLFWMELRHACVFYLSSYTHTQRERERDFEWQVSSS